MIFLVDTGASRTSLNYIPLGLEPSDQWASVASIKGERFTVSVFKPTSLRFKNRTVVGQLLYVPKAGSNLLGRDLVI